MSRNTNKIQRNYVSEVDIFLQAFDESHPDRSRSQQKEIAKSRRISRLRDEAHAIKPTHTLWDDF